MAWRNWQPADRSIDLNAISLSGCTRLAPEPAARRPAASDETLTFCAANVELRIAHSQLRETIAARRGLFLVTGPAGIGKTVLLRQLGRELSDAGFRVVSSYRPSLLFRDLALAVLREIGEREDGGNRTDLIAGVREAIADQVPLRAGTVLLIDDAQQLGGDVLRNLPTLLRAADGAPAALSLVLAGRPGLAERLHAPVLEFLAQVLALACRLDGWRDREICELISLRLRQDRWLVLPRLSTAEIEAIARYSGGNPGRAVCLAEAVLHEATSSGGEAIWPQVIDRAAGELKLSASLKNDRHNAFWPRLLTEKSGYVSAAFLGALALSIIFFDTIAGRTNTQVAEPIFEQRASRVAAEERSGSAPGADAEFANEPSGSSSALAVAAGASTEQRSRGPNLDENSPGAFEQLPSRRLRESRDGSVADTGWSPTEPAPRLETGNVQLPPEVLALLMRRGAEMMASGDIAAARLLFERAAAAGEAKAATAAGQTFDPIILKEIPTRGVLPAADQAVKWYYRAIQAGDTEAEGYLLRLQQSIAR